MSGYEGLLVIDKPEGITSREAVDRVARWFPRRTRIGHTGTLDPLATGVLVLCLGNATRLVEYVQEMGKTYTSTFHLGATSESDDGEGLILPTPDAVPPTQEELETALTGFHGLISQIPPVFSATRIGGKRAHDLARKGREVQLTPRPVRIDRITLKRYEYPELDLQIDCGKGTYIRSLARDLGVKLGCGGYVKALRRTRVGPFHADQAVSLSLHREEARGRLLPIEMAVSELPRLVCSEAEWNILQAGQPIPLIDPLGEDGQGIAVFSEAGKLTLVGEVRRNQRELWPDKVLYRLTKRSDSE